MDVYDEESNQKSSKVMPPDISNETKTMTTPDFIP
jgi:hypothetical protein